MKGLVIKDLLNLKHYFSKKDIIVIGILVFVVTSTLTQYAIPIISAIGLMIVGGYCNTFSISDRESQWKEYESILPVTLGQRVKSRYIVCLGLLCLLFLIMCIINLIAGNILNLTNYFTLLLIEFIFVYLQVLIALPASFSKGKDGASYVWILFLIIILAIYLLVKYNLISFSLLLKVLNFNNIQTSIFSLMILILGTITSYNTSVKMNSLD